MGKMIMLKNVRCSFPQLWETEDRGGQTYSRSITLLLDPADNAPLIAKVRAAVEEELAANPKVKASVANKPHMLALRSGEDHPEYGEGVQVLKANAPRTPVVMHANATRATPENDPIYSGCRVNAKVELWAQDNNFGKRINAKLVAVQFAGDDVSFDGSYVPDDVAADGFTSVERDADDF